jgi:hypothetical protein
MLVMTTRLGSLKPNMIYDKITFPIFTLHTDEIMFVDGILWIENQVLDDTNVKEKTLGLRRLKSPMNSMYPLKSMITDVRSYLQHQGKFYIDTKGRFFRKNKTVKAELKYHKIIKIEKKDTASVLWVKGCNYPFTLERPLAPSEAWVGLLYRGRLPWLVYDTSEEKKKDTWRKI